MHLDIFPGLTPCDHLLINCCLHPGVKDEPVERTTSTLAQQQRDVAVDDSPLTSLEKALEKVSRAAARKASAALRTQLKEDLSPSSEQEDAATDSVDDFVTPISTPQELIDSLLIQTPQPSAAKPKKTPKSKKFTGKISTHFITDRVDLYNTTSSGKRVPAGTSVVPVPSIHAERFGIVQEKLWREPFWLLIAVTLW